LFNQLLVDAIHLCYTFSVIRKCFNSPADPYDFECGFVASRHHDDHEFLLLLANG